MQNTIIASTTPASSTTAQVVPGVTAKRRADGTLMDANRQWATRPADERFDTLESFRAAMFEHRRRSVGGTAPRGSLRAVADAGEVMLVGPGRNQPVRLTHWAFGQAARLANAPAGYLQNLPAPLAADCLQHGLSSEGLATIGGDHALLLRREDDGPRIHALTSDKYARVWNVEIADRLLAYQAANPTWGNPEAFRTSVGQADNAWGEHRTLPCAFGGDRDCFVFLCDYTHTVDVAGQDHPLARGFFLTNSEVGAASLRVTFFLFDFVCANMIVWGAKDVVDVSIRHIGDANAKFHDALGRFALSSPKEDERKIRAAQSFRFASTKEETIEVIGSKRIPGITATNLGAAIEIANANPRYGDPLSAWAITNGLTEYSQRDAAHADKRIDLDRAAGKLLRFAF